jgi:hypothetical protein
LKVATRNTSKTGNGTGTGNSKVNPATLALTGKLDPNVLYPLQANVPADVFDAAVKAAVAAGAKLNEAGDAFAEKGGISLVVRPALFAQFAPHIDYAEWARVYEASTTERKKAVGNKAGATRVVQKQKADLLDMMLQAGTITQDQVDEFRARMSAEGDGAS